jgi:antitoxin component of RelBE/YafQ-DinJ toxin-antitoxin module
MNNPRSRVVSFRVPNKTYIELLTVAETKNLTLTNYCRLFLEENAGSGNQPKTTTTYSDEWEKVARKCEMENKAIKHNYKMELDDVRKQCSDKAKNQAAEALYYKNELAELKKEVEKIVKEANINEVKIKAMKLKALMDNGLGGVYTPG